MPPPTKFPDQDFGETCELQRVAETLEPLDHISFQEQEENPSRER